MEPAAEVPLQFAFKMRKVLEKSIAIMKSSPKTFLLISLTFILPLCVAIVARSLFTLPLMTYIPIQAFICSDGIWTRHFLLEVIHLTLIFVFSVISTGAIVFTVSSFYTSTPVSFSSTLFAIPRVFKPLCITFLFFSFFVILSNVAVMLFWVFLYTLLNPHDHLYLHLFLFFVFYYLIFLPSLAYISALWHLASVISVMEPVYGLEAVKRSKAMLEGKTAMAMEFVILYLGIYGEIEVVCSLARGMFVMVLCAVALLILNLVGLLVQSVFYFKCKNYNPEEIDKCALFEHLGGYVGEYVPVKCSTDMPQV